MTKTAFLIPYKGTKKAKTRLRKELDDEAVDKLLLFCLNRIIRTLSSLRTKETEIYILTKNSEIKLKYAVNILMDKGESLNEVISKAVKEIEAENIIIIMADLFKLQKRIVKRIINLLDNYSAVIAPSSDKGTSVIAFSKDILQKIDFCFGYNSSIHFERQFKEKNINYLKLAYKKTFKDIDNLEDIREIKNPPKELNSVFTARSIKNERKNREDTKNSKKKRD